MIFKMRNHVVLFTFPASENDSTESYMVIISITPDALIQLCAFNPVELGSLRLAGLRYVGIFFMSFPARVFLFLCVCFFHTSLPVGIADVVRTLA